MLCTDVENDMDDEVLGMRHQVSNKSPLVGCIIGNVSHIGKSSPQTLIKYISLLHGYELSAKVGHSIQLIQIWMIV